MKRPTKMLIIVVAVLLTASIYLPLKGYYLLLRDYNYRAASLADLRWQLVDSSGSRIYRTLNQNISEVELTDGLTVRRASATSPEHEKVYVAYVGIPSALGKRYQLLQADYDLMRTVFNRVEQDGKPALFKTTFYFLAYKNGLLIEIVSDQSFHDTNGAPLYSYEMNGEYTQFFYLKDFSDESYMLISKSYSVTVSELCSWLETSSLAGYAS